MKWGGLIILWVGGLLSIVTLMGGWPSDLDVRVYGPGIVMARVAEKVGIVLAIWIMCGLVWVSPYKRSRTKKKQPRPTEQTILTERKNMGDEIQMSASLKVGETKGYGYSELEIMKQQFMRLLRGAALWIVLCFILAIVAILVAKFS
jgi:hypothetical protein